MRKKRILSPVRIFNNSDLSLLYSDDESIKISGDLLRHDIKFPLIDAKKIEHEAKITNLKDDFLKLAYEQKGAGVHGHIIYYNLIFKFLDTVYNEVKKADIYKPKKIDFITDYFIFAASEFKKHFRTKKIIVNIHKSLPGLYEIFENNFNKLIEIDNKKSSHQLTIPHELLFPTKIHIDDKAGKEFITTQGRNVAVKEIMSKLYAEKAKEQKENPNKKIERAYPIFLNQHGDEKIFCLTAMKLFREIGPDQEIIITAYDFLKRCGFDMDNVSKGTKSNLYKSLIESLRNFAKRDLLYIRAENGKNKIGRQTNLFIFNDEKEIKSNNKNIESVILNDKENHIITDVFSNTPGQIILKFADYKQLIYSIGSGQNINLKTFMPLLEITDRRTRAKLIDACFNILVPFAYEHKEYKGLTLDSLNLSSIRKPKRKEMLNILSGALKRYSDIEIKENEGQIMAKRM